MTEKKITPLSKLREQTYEVTPKVLTDVKDLVLDVIGRCRAYLEQNPSIISIAANQVNSNYRIVCYRNKAGEIINCINPKITDEYAAIKQAISDPSFPGLVTRILTYSKIRATYLQADETGLKHVTVKLDNEYAIHFRRAVMLLNNIVIFDEAIKNVNWRESLLTVLQYGGSRDYYLHGENKLFFSGLEIDPTVTDDVVGVSVLMKQLLEPKPILAPQTNNPKGDNMSQEENTQDTPVTDGVGTGTNATDEVETGTSQAPAETPPAEPSTDDQVTDPPAEGSGEAAAEEENGEDTDGEDGDEAAGSVDL